MTTHKFACVQAPIINLRFTSQLIELALCMQVNFSYVLSSAIFFQNHFFHEKNISAIQSVVSSSLDPDQ